jgi:prepilin-type N-terminal cleavage/methylation domain-containing protein
MSEPQAPIRIRKSNGFTLVEIVITIVVVGIIAGIAAMIIAEGARAYSDERSRSDVHYQARLAMERMAREARMVRSCGDINGPANPSATLSFTDSNGNAVSYTVNAGTKVLSRGADLLATGIMSAQPFRFLDQNGNETTACSVPAVATDIWFIEISLTDTQNSETLQMRTRVHPRNF